MTRKEMLALVEQTLDEVLPKSGTRPAELSDAMRYAVGTGGKRIRPLICLASAQAVGGDCRDARYAAAAIELLHNYTLVHDDLPAMDNDVMRRGKPTVWKAYGHAEAILVGDALQALAFRAAAKVPANAREVVAELADKALGVVAGQVEDIQKTSDSEFIYIHKTADLFVAAAVMGGLAAGASADDVAALREFALNLGLAFQYEDDLLDGDSPYDCDKTEQLARMTTDAAKAALARISGDTALLAEIAESLFGRKV